MQDSIRIITEYYQNNYEPFFSAIADDVLWIGPRAGQVIRGKENIVAAWQAEENHGLTFSMGNITADSISTGSGSLEVILQYFVYTHFPDGETDQHHQRLHYSWGKRKTDNGWVHQICMIHISNIAEGAQGKIYAASPSESHIDALNPSRVFFRTVAGKGENEVLYYFNSATIRYIESADKGTHSVVHSMEGNYKTIERLTYFERNFPDVLIRSHTSCLVNPLFVKSVWRFKLRLDDGTELPIPEKKYTAFKRKLKGFFLKG